MGNLSKVVSRLKGFNLWLLLGPILVFAPLANAGTRQGIVSLDMCADQYALALLPQDEIAGLSLRAQHPDLFYRLRAEAFPRRRASLETVLAQRPRAVIRTWGGDARLLSGLKAHGIEIIQISDPADVPAARAELLRVGALLRQPQQALHEARLMDVAVAAISKQGRGRGVLYYTPSGYTAGPKTWVGELLKTMNYKVQAQQNYYAYLSPEAFLTLTPDVYALGFYEDKYAMRRVAGRHPLVRKKIAGQETIVLPSPAIACNAWYSAQAMQEGMGL
ncbi:iron ABC transporter substrate-binding protein [Asticcacaulis sp. ZE23SCel15]|uniref:ABC transporter substrate-binding protein n=1 Tax=Asticcacaulis sp. ZE23SCel15 TaxID=3059027 RepID=UPI00265E1B01|nr:iron ABC transporter substrate-binding protein [Asticcacaulis sp. ZE23SCel15]WKL56471.1 iron ABC transporter substrate-binding protein [Asticcacaulis sp. ZE23SCel15]